MFGLSGCIFGRSFNCSLQHHTLVFLMVSYRILLQTSKHIVMFSGTMGMVEHLERGNRLEKPSLCPDKIYTIMTDCWKREPMERPTFKHLKSRLDAFNPILEVQVLPPPRPSRSPPSPSQSQPIPVRTTPSQPQPRHVEPKLPKNSSSLTY